MVLLSKENYTPCAWDSSLWAAPHCLFHFLTDSIPAVHKRASSSLTSFASWPHSRKTQFSCSSTPSLPLPLNLSFPIATLLLSTILQPVSFVHQGVLFLPCLGLLLPLCLLPLSLFCCSALTCRRFPRLGLGALFSSFTGPLSLDLIFSFTRSPIC